MADSLKTRVGRIIAGSVHALVDHLENHAPLAVMEQSLREADTVIGEVRHELGRTSANRHLAQQQHAHLNGQHGKLAEQIDQALAAGREDLARAAVARQLDIEAQIPVLETTLADFARQESELTGYVAALQAKQREMSDALEGFRQSRASAAPAPLQQHRAAPALPAAWTPSPAPSTACMRARPACRAPTEATRWTRPPSSRSSMTWCATTRSPSAWHV